MHSADYAVARCLSVHLSVYLSHAAILSNRINALSIFSPSVGHAILVYSAPNGMDVECRWDMKNRYLPPIYRFISVMIDLQDILTTADQ